MRSAAFRLNICLVIGALLWADLSAQSTSSQEPEPALFTSEYVTAHLLLQVGTRLRLGTDPTGGTYRNNVTAHTSRLQLRGDLGSGFDYYVQWEATRTPGLLDTRVSYRLNRLLAFDAGFYKTPGGLEFLTATENTDFISSASLLALSPARDAGVQARVSLTNELELRAGVFNGNGSFSGSDNTDFLSMGRLSYTSRSGGDGIAAGISGGTDPQTAANGSYTFGSADIRVTASSFLMAAEAIYRTGKVTATAPSVKSYGFYITTGYSLTERTGVKARFQRLSTDGFAHQDDLILNLGYTPNAIVGVSVEAIFPVKTPFTYTVPARILTQAQIFL